MRSNVGSSNMELRIANRQYTDTSDYAVILWDNDGVLVDTERLYLQATREVFARFGVDVTEELYFEYYLLGSSGTSRLASAHGLSETDAVELRNARNTRYQRLLEQEQIAIDGVRETLAALLLNGRRTRPGNPGVSVGPSSVPIST